MAKTRHKENMHLINQELIFFLCDLIAREKNRVSNLHLVWSHGWTTKEAKALCMVWGVVSWVDLELSVLSWSGVVSWVGLEWCHGLVWSGVMGWSGVVSWVGLEWCHELVWSGVMGWSGVVSWVGLEWCHGLVWSGVMGWS